MFKKLFSFLSLANNSLPKDNSSNIKIQAEYEVIEIEKSPIMDNLGLKLFPKIHNIKTKEKFNIPKILYESNKNSHQKLESWLFYDYLRNFYSLTEAKYKVLTLSVLLKNKNINIDAMPSIKDMVFTISDELIAKKELSFNAKNNLFTSQTIYDGMFIPVRFSYSKGHIGKQFYEIIEEDSNDEEKINIAKKIWLDFNGAGLLAYSLNDSSVNTKCFANLQNNKLFDSDLERFKETTEQQKSNNDILPPSLYSLTEHQKIWKKIIDNEDGIDKLTIIKNLAIAASLRSTDVSNFLNNQFGFSLGNEKDNSHVVLKHVSSRIIYLEMESELSDEPIDKPKTKKLKIKL